MKTVLMSKLIDSQSSFSKYFFFIKIIIFDSSGFIFFLFKTSTYNVIHQNKKKIKKNVSKKKIKKISMKTNIFCARN